MNESYLKEKIGVLKILIPLLWTGLFLLSGGLISYIKSGNSLFHDIFSVLGVYIDIVLLLILLFTLKETRKSLKKLKG